MGVRSRRRECISCPKRYKTAPRIDGQVEQEITTACGQRGFSGGHWLSRGGGESSGGRGRRSRAASALCHGLRGGSRIDRVDRAWSGRRLRRWARSRASCAAWAELEVGRRNRAAWIRPRPRPSGHPERPRSSRLSQVFESGFLRGGTRRDGRDAPGRPAPAGGAGHALRVRGAASPDHGIECS